jgi:SAM-dependent methyltransferase
MLGRALARQLSRPEGVLGRIVARLMNRFNRDMSRMAIAAIEVARGDDVLEIGFGGGANLDPLLVAAGTGKVTGLDLSETMVLRAQRRFAWAVREGRLQVRLGQVDWSPQGQRSWEEFRLRLGAQVPRWTALGLHYHRSPLVPWRER